MTRDEAINILRKKPNLSCSAEEITIDAFVALGILKLDEPKSVDQRLDKALAYRCWYGDPHFNQLEPIDPEYLRWVLNKYDLKIVEK